MKDLLLKELPNYKYFFFVEILLFVSRIIFIMFKLTGFIIEDNIVGVHFKRLILIFNMSAYNTKNLDVRTYKLKCEMNLFDNKKITRKGKKSHHN